jgi:hypothetical protein
MSLKIISVFLFFLSINFNWLASDRNADTYSIHLEKVKNFDETVYFKELRLAYTMTPAYKP